MHGNNPELSMDIEEKEASENSIYNSNDSLPAGAAANWFIKSVNPEKRKTREIKHQNNWWTYRTSPWTKTRIVVRHIAS